MASIPDFVQLIEDSLSSGEFVKITLSKPVHASSELRNVYIRKILIKNKGHLSFTFRYKTNDQVKNYLPKAGLEEIDTLLENIFMIANLFTIHEQVTIESAPKGNYKLNRKGASNVLADTSHDQNKSKRVEADSRYLKLLGVSDENGKVIPKMADKYRQINKYLEILDGLITSNKFPNKISIVDMGSGKGYLTFALYDFLKNKQRLEVTVLGIELRRSLVDFCNKTAKECGFDGLSFESRTIESVKDQKIDILIALHACDTATDDALAAGIFSDASLIVTAPCCHKQIRKQVKGREQENPLLKYGIFRERQLEMVTDAMRGMLLEKHGYRSKIFEFVSNEHTRKNIMLVGQKVEKKASVETIDKQISDIKDEYHIEYHYLEKLLE